MRRVPAALIACALGVLIAGCGGAGVSSGATVSVYVSAPMRGPEGKAGRALCAGAREEVARAGGAAGDVRVRVVCLDASGPGGGWTLARVGADARRAVEDSTAVAYIGEPDRGARRQSRPIVEAAEVAEIAGYRGAAAMGQILRAIDGAGSEAPREAVFNNAGGR